MNADQNHFTVDFADNTLKVHVNGKLVVAYRKQDLAPSVLEVIFDNVQHMIRTSNNRDYFESTIVMLQVPSRGSCTICGRFANLLGGICYTCSLHEAKDTRI